MVSVLEALGLRWRRCRWQRDGWRANARRARWVCARCRAEAFTDDGRPPKECKRAVRPTAP